MAFRAERNICKGPEAWNNALSLGNYKEFNVAGTGNVRELGKWDRR